MENDERKFVVSMRVDLVFEDAQVAHSRMKQIWETIKYVDAIKEADLYGGVAIQHTSRWEYQYDKTTHNTLPDPSVY